jgi:hypothetical protein
MQSAGNCKSLQASYLRSASIGLKIQLRSAIGPIGILRCLLYRVMMKYGDLRSKTPQRRSLPED